MVGIDGGLGTDALFASEAATLGGVAGGTDLDGSDFDGGDFSSAGLNPLDAAVTSCCFGSLEHPVQCAMRQAPMRLATPAWVMTLARSLFWYDVFTWYSLVIRLSARRVLSLNHRTDCGNTASFRSSYHSSSKPMKMIPLANGDALPSVGLGFWKIDRSRTADVTLEAARIGYRHWDCAADYGNEAEVGEGIARVLGDRVCSRDEMWITSKLWNTYHRPSHVAQACRRSLKDLRVDSLDLYLVHFPIALAYVPFEVRYPAGWFFDPEATPPKMIPDPVPIAETWGAMERLV